MCDFDPGVALVTRKDDDLDKIRKRIEVFQAETAPLEGYYRSTSRLRDVLGLGPTEEVFQRVVDALRVAA
jgi:adenylate kinase